VDGATFESPSLVNLLIKVAIIASRVGKGLNTLGHEGKKQYRVNLTDLKQLALYYFNLKRKEATTEVLKVVQQRLWRDTYESILPILQNMYQLTDIIQPGKYWSLKRAIEALYYGQKSDEIR
jgi:transposase, IS5 family